MILNCNQLFAISSEIPATHILFLVNKSINQHLHTWFDYGIDSLLLVTTNCVEYAYYSSYANYWRVKYDNSKIKRENKFISWFKNIYYKFIN